MRLGLAVLAALVAASVPLSAQTRAITIDDNASQDRR